MRSAGGVARTIVEPNGWRRVHIIARHDGHFGYAEERYYHYDPDNESRIRALGAGLVVLVRMRFT